MIRVLCAGVILLAGCGPESYTEIEKTRAPLFPGFDSYASRAEVMQKFPRDVEIKVVEEVSLAKNDSIPPYRIYSVAVAPYRHLEQPGKLLVTFYNDRLLQTAYYPERLDDYLEALRKRGVAVEFGQELFQGHTVIWIGTDFDNKQYVGWADKRLRDQQRRWLANYQ